MTRTASKDRPPTGGRDTMTLRFAPGLKERIDAVADEHGISTNAEINLAITEHLRRVERKVLAAKAARRDAKE